MSTHDALIFAALLLLCTYPALERQVGAWWKRRAKPPVSAAQLSEFVPLTEQEFRAALSVAEDNPLWRAVMQSIAVMQAEAIGETIDTDTQLRPALMHHYAGAALHLHKLAEFLKAEREKAVELVAGEEDE